MRISEAANNAGVNLETVRFYERKGMITQPARPANGGFRDYAPAIVDHILFIKHTQELGFSLKEVEGQDHLKLITLKLKP